MWEGTTQGRACQEGEDHWGPSWRLAAKHGKMLEAEQNRQEMWSLLSRNLCSKANHIETDMDDYDSTPLSLNLF